MKGEYRDPPAGRSLRGVTSGDGGARNQKLAHPASDQQSSPTALDQPCTMPAEARGEHGRQGWQVETANTAGKEGGGGQEDCRKGEGLGPEVIGVRWRTPK